MQISAFQQLMKQIAPSAKNLPFHSGDLVKGTIQKLFPNQLALVNIHNVTVLAKLEAPLEAFQSYWFEVQPKNGDKPYLKLLQPQTASQGSQDLFTLTGMSSSKTNRALVDFFLEQKLPIPKNIGDVSAWIKGDAPTPLDKQVLQLIAQRELPFTKTVFTSLAAALKDTSISAEANQLSALLAEGPDVKGEPIQQLARLLTTIAGNEKVFSSVEGSQSLKELSQLMLTDIKQSRVAPTSILADWLSRGNAESLKRPWTEILAALESESDRSILENQLKTLDEKGQNQVFRDVLSSNKPEFIKGLTELFLNDVSKKSVLSASMILDWAESLQGEEGKALLLRFLNDSHATGDLEKLHQLQTFVDRKGSLISADKPLMDNKNRTADLSQGADTLKPKVMQLLTDLLSRQQVTAKEIMEVLIGANKMSTPNTVSSQDQSDAQDIVKNLKAIIQSLGMSHEHDVKNALNMSSSPHQVEELQTLKALLMKSEALIPPQGKEVAETLLQKITGFQLLSQDNGPVTSLYMQLPLPLGETTKDVTIQWSGKKTKNDQIDPAYCHILFYLRLDHLEDTIVDVRVQNRVVTIGVINDHPATGALIGVKKPELQEALAQLNYRLTEVKTVPSHGSAKKQGTLFPSASSSQSYTGVDFRI
ncbi:hypothetical protein [Priestia koreensis]|uniref:hypothetical protein n=1 Tax=Priestia koreensis TaxID=284581 RepID=UPI0006A97B0F|nr:hypothetical protein [Priestia koreensis]